MGVMSSSVHSPGTTLRRACRFPESENQRILRIKADLPRITIIDATPGEDNTSKYQDLHYH